MNGLITSISDVYKKNWPGPQVDFDRVMEYMDIAIDVPESVVYSGKASKTLLRISSKCRSAATMAY